MLLLLVLDLLKIILKLDLFFEVEFMFFKKCCWNDVIYWNDVKFVILWEILSKF